MKYIVLVLLMGLAGPAAAELTGVVEQPNGAVVNLPREAGPCVGNGHRAEYVDPIKHESVTGCWTVQPNGVVTVAFLDGDFMAVPLRAIQQPKAL